jgi:hypothetical protein
VSGLSHDSAAACAVSRSFESASSTRQTNARKRLPMPAGETPLSARSSCFHVAGIAFCYRDATQGIGRQS